MTKTAIELKLKHALSKAGYTLYKSRAGYWCKHTQCRYMIACSSFPVSETGVRFNMSFEDVIEWTNYLYNR